MLAKTSMTPPFLTHFKAREIELLLPDVRNTEGESASCSKGAVLPAAMHHRLGRETRLQEPKAPATHHTAGSFAPA